MTNYKLGKLPARVDPRTLKLSKFLVKKALPPLPATFDVDSAFTNFSDTNMFGNDQYGDCVIAGRAHMTLRFEDFEQSLLLPISTKDCTTEYFKETGGQDSGLDMLTSLNLWRKSGLTAADKIYTIYAYAQINKSNHDELMYSVFLLKGAYTGFNVPKSAMDQFNAGQPWTVVANDGGIEGGHCVYIVGYDSTGPVCVTWGAKQHMTWEFWDKYFDEAYAVIDNVDPWMNPAADPLDVSALSNELNEITNTPTPTPPTPPTPSPCPIGNGLAKLANFFPWMLHRKGRFNYMNPSKKESSDESSDFKKSAAFVFSGIITVATSAILEFHSEWQLNAMQNTYVWGGCQANINFFNWVLSQGYVSLANLPFQDGIFRTTFGTANDIFLALITVGWVLGMVGVFFIMYGFMSFIQAKYKRLKKIMKDNGFDKPLFP